MTEEKVSNRYAKAAIETAVIENCTNEVFESFQYIDRVIASSKDLRALLMNPIILPWKKKKALSEIFEGKIHALNYHFIMLLVDKSREFLIPSIIVQFNNQFNLLNNNLSIEIHSAKELADETKSNIIGKLSDWTKKNSFTDLHDRQKSSRRYFNSYRGLGLRLYGEKSTLHFV